MYTSQNRTIFSLAHGASKLNNMPNAYSTTRGIPLLVYSGSTIKLSVVACWFPAVLIPIWKLNRCQKHSHMPFTWLIYVTNRSCPADVNIVPSMAKNVRKWNYLPLPPLGWHNSSRCITSFVVASFFCKFVCTSPIYRWFTNSCHVLVSQDSDAVTVCECVHINQYIGDMFQYFMKMCRYPTLLWKYVV